MNKLLFFIFCVIQIDVFGQTCHFSGWIKDETTHEVIVDAFILQDGTTNYQLSNGLGYFSLALSKNKQVVKFVITAFGYKPLEVNYSCINRDTLIYLQKDLAKEFDEVVVSAQRNHQIGTISLSVEELKKIPMLGGEADIIRALQLMPGVQGGKEGTSGLYVRGGSPDQNLFLLDDVPLYNVNHIGGFLSAFDPNAINSLQMYKGNFPARYSGRLSSVIDLRMKNGNQRKTAGEVQVGLLSTKLNLEGPLGKDSSWTYFVSGRRFNIDIFTRIISAISTKGQSNAGYTFFDSNLKLVKRFKDNSTLSFGFYGGRDRIFVNAKESSYNPYRYKSNVKWGNVMGYMQFHKAFSNKLFYTVNLASTHFFYSSGVDMIEKKPGEDDQNSAILFNSKITDVLLKQSLNYKINNNWTLVGGWNMTGHIYLPGKMTAHNFNKDTILGNERLKALENNLYLENQFHIQNKLKANVGLNMSSYSISKSTFNSFEPRFLLAYMPHKKVSIQVGYAKMQQFVHYLSNSGAGLPSDIWVPATNDMRPEKSQQWNAGLILPDVIKKFPLEFSLEAYYKKLSGLIDYREGASLLSPQSLSSKVETDGKGYIYGLEFMVKRSVGKVNGWLAYTYSKNMRQFDQINNGNWYPFKFDRTHDISLVLNFKINDRIDVSATWVYMTGNAFTLAQGQYEYLEPMPTNSYVGYDPTDNTAHIYNGKNSVRLPAYHRLDIGANFSKQKKRGVRIWNVSIYNVYNRQNAFFYFYQIGGNGTAQLNQLTIFPIIPSFSYRFVF